MHIKTPFSIHFIPEMYSFFQLSNHIIPERGKILSKQAVQKVCVGNIQHPL